MENLNRIYDFINTSKKLVYVGYLFLVLLFGWLFYHIDWLCVYVEQNIVISLSLTLLSIVTAVVIFWRKWAIDRVKELNVEAKNSVKIAVVNHMNVWVIVFAIIIVFTAAILILVALFFEIEKSCNCYLWGIFYSGLLMMILFFLAFCFILFDYKWEDVVNENFRKQVKIYNGMLDYCKTVVALIALVLERTQESKLKHQIKILEEKFNLDRTEIDAYKTSRNMMRKIENTDVFVDLSSQTKILESIIDKIKLHA